MKTPHFLAAALAVACVSCAAAPTEYAKNYTRSLNQPKLKPIPSANVTVEEFSNEAAFSARIANLRGQGYVMTGHSDFKDAYIPTDLAKNFAAAEGCERVLLMRRKIGQGLTSTMIYGGSTSPSIDFVPTPMFTPSGTYYTPSAVYRAPQPIMVPHDYPYDIYHHNAAFFTRPTNFSEHSPEKRTAQW